MGHPIDADDAATAIVAPEAHAGFIWLHFNLSNQASRRWLLQHLVPPDAFLDALDETATRVEVGPGAIVAAIKDLAVFAPDGTEASPLVLLVTERLLVSARRTPLRSIDRLHAAVRGGEQFRTPVGLFAHLLRDQAGMLEQIVREANAQVDDVEDRLIANDVAASRSILGGLRRTLVKVQRLLTPMRVAMSRLLGKPPAWIAGDDLADLRDSVEDIGAAAAGCSEMIDRIKLLQDEVFAVVSEQTNRTLFILTIVTVLALPMTIVSGFFGMNVAGVPFQHGGGFWLVVTLTIGASAAGAVLLLRRRGRS
jgi:zinc transporter